MPPATATAGAVAGGHGLAVVGATLGGRLGLQQPRASEREIKGGNPCLETKEEGESFVSLLLIY